jgi:glycolate oxidase FAD binding subunit
VSAARATPASIAEAAEVLRDCRSVRFAGGGTKAAWGEPIEAPEVELATTAMCEIVEHNAGDLTGILDAGVQLERAQQAFHDAGQMLAVDPPDPGGATIGGMVATADSGPLRHRYGAVRDLVVGATLVLADGTVARSGGKVIKNVAGYDLAKLFCGSFGSLGLVARVAVRLHPLPRHRLTLVARAKHAATLRDAAVTLAQTPVEFDSLDVCIDGSRREILGRLGGADPGGRLEAAQRALASLSVDLATLEDDGDVWAGQSAAQRSEGGGAVLKVSGLPSALDKVIDTVDGAGGRMVGRAAMGLFWITVDGDDADLVAAIDDVRGRLPEFHCVLRDAPEPVRRKVDVWGRVDDGVAGIMKRIKQRFDPLSKCNPGLFAGAI